MTGIVSFGAYIPYYRITREVMGSAMGWLGPPSVRGEKAVANFDEDSVSMAVAAGIDCLSSMEREKIDGLYFATTTQPYVLRQNAGIIATALDLRPDIRAIDFTDSTKSGTSAFLSACDAVKGESVANILLCTSDNRLGKPGSSEDYIYGDGAAAFLLGKEGVVATIEGSHSISYDFIDHRRAQRDEFEHSWEDRWIRDEGYAKFIPQAIMGLLEKYELSINAFAKVIYPCTHPRVHAAIGKRLGIAPDRIQDPMLTTVGDTGAPHPLMMLIAALEEAKPGEKILVVSYGNGCDAFTLQVTEEIGKVRDKRGIKKHLASKKELSSYEKYLAFRNLITPDIGIRGEEILFTQISTLWRERKRVLGLVGSQCRRCGTPQYPDQIICVNPKCGACDEMDEYRFSGQRGILSTYACDNLAISMDPPEKYGMVDFVGGGRFIFDMTDCDSDSLKLDMEVEMTFRRREVDESRAIHNYFWKAMPVRA